MKFKFYALKLCLIMIVIFLIQIVFNGFTELFVLNQSFYFQIWRFVTAIFLHGGVAHLLYNLFALALFGSILESFIGGKRFLLVFFTTGIFANLVAVNFYESSLGASGSIMGVIGALVVVRPLLMVWAFGLPMPMFIAGILWMIGDFIGLFVPSNVGNIAHLAGIFLGLVLGSVFRNWKKKERKNVVRIDEGSMRNWEDSYLR